MKQCLKIGKLSKIRPNSQKLLFLICKSRLYICIELMFNYISRYCIYNKFCTLSGWKVARSYSLSFIKHEFFVKTLSINFWIIFISRRFLFSLRSLSSAASGVSPSTYFLLNIFIICFLYFLFFFFILNRFFNNFLDFRTFILWSW